MAGWLAGGTGELYGAIVDVLNGKGVAPLDNARGEEWVDAAAAGIKKIQK